MPVAYPGSTPPAAIQGSRETRRMSIPTDPKFTKLKKILQHLEGKVRVRVGGLLFDAPDDPNALVLVEHAGIWSNEPFWTPPGGGVEFGESLEEAVVREVKEETGLDVEVGPLRYVLDFIRPPLHAVSFYFECKAPGRLAGLTSGSDPELGDAQLIRAVRMVALEDLTEMNVYPEGMGEWLPEDAQGGFVEGVRYVGLLT
jgi:ADP-ribose pyrophosphatase YjhB (NUDIX family)